MIYKYYHLFFFFLGIEVCLEYKQKVDEEVFEAQGTKHQPNSQGPKQARKNMEQKVRFLCLFICEFNMDWDYIWKSNFRPLFEKITLRNISHAQSV